MLVCLSVCVSAYDAERMGQSLMCHPSLRGRLSALVAKGLAAEELDKTAQGEGDGETADADEVRHTHPLSTKGDGLCGLFGVRLTHRQEGASEGGWSDA